MDESPIKLVSEIGTQLAQRTRPNKDFIVKSLRQAANALSQLEQSPQPQNTKEIQATKKREAALEPLGSAIVGGLLQHNDKDVKLLVAICVTELFRVKAPEPPFEDKHLREVFKLIIGLFADLADTSSPLFSKRVKVLDTVAQLRCCVIMLEIDCKDLVLKMFNVFFSVVRDDHHDSLIRAMSSIMINVLSESEEASQQLLEVILQNLVKRKKDATCAAYQLAASVVKTCAQEDELNSLVRRVLTSCIQDRDAMGCKLKEFYHEIIFQVFQCAPQMLLDVIPSLIEELLADQVDVRIKAVNLVGKLFALPEHRVALKNRNLFEEFMKRFSDKSVDVRISALQCARAFYVANPYGRESCEIITSVEDRLLDFDDRVRMQAVLVACDISSSNLRLVPPRLISQTTERLRDKKISVRKRALQKLIELYRHYCTKCCEGSMKIGDHFEEIPCKILMLCYDKDCKEFRSQNMESFLADDLFPEHLSVEERTKHWIHIFYLFSSLHEKALNTIMAQKRRLQNDMKNYLAMRKKVREICSDSEEMLKKIESIFTKIAASFSDSLKAEECLHKLNQIKDNNVFKSLEKLLEEQTFTIGQGIKDELLVMIGDSNPHYEFLRSLFSKCSSNIFSSEHVQCILDHLSNNQSGNKDLEDSSANLLLAIVRIFPSMLKGSEKQFQMLLEQMNPVNDKLIQVVAKAGSHISFNLSDIYPFLKEKCLHGTRREAKYAVSAIAALNSEQSVFLDLYEGLIDSLYSLRKLPTTLQSLGCILQYPVLTSEPQYEDITSYICQNIIQMEHLDDDQDATSFSDTSRCSKSCQLKIFGLKTLVKCSLPFQGNRDKQNVNGLLDILSRMLQESDSFVSTNTGSCEYDMAHIRLAAAKAILRLARKWDLHITPEIFRFTILVAEDSSSSVRSAFLSKTHKLFKERKLPIRYACAFAFGVTDHIEDLLYHSYKYLAEFIKDYSIVARKRQTSAVQGPTIDHPAYILVFLIHMLAHNIDFPFEACQDEKLWANLCSPLFIVLQTLVDVSIVDGDLNLVNDAVLYQFSIFRAIRKAEDAVDEQMTTKLHMLAEIGVFTLNALKHDGISLSQAPGQVLLPSSLYKVSLAKNEANSKIPKSFFDESFLNKVFHTLKRSSTSQAYGQKLAKTLPKHGHKSQQDVPRPNINICSVLDLASSKPDDLSRRDITSGKTVRPNIPSAKGRKCAPLSASGSIGLHECSTIEKRQKLTSKHGEKTLEGNLVSSSGSVNCKGSMAESYVPNRKSKRAAVCSLENAVTSSKHAIQHFKLPRTNLNDTCGSKKQDILADVSNKNHYQHCDPGEHSSLSNIKKTTAKKRGLSVKEGTLLNQENSSMNGRGRCTDTSSEVVNTNAYSGRTRRKV